MMGLKILRFTSFPEKPETFSSAPLTRTRHFTSDIEVNKFGIAITSMESTTDKCTKVI